MVGSVESGLSLVVGRIVEMWPSESVITVGTAELMSF